MLRLCEIHPKSISARKNKQTTTLRWTLVLKEYKKIRNLVLANPQVMKDTGIQLFEVNNSTLSTWYNNKEKKAEKAVLGQAITMDKPTRIAPRPLPPAMALPATLPQVPEAQQHRFLLPDNTAGQTPVRKQKPSTVSTPTPLSATISTPAPDLPENTAMPQNVMMPQIPNIIMTPPPAIATPQPQQFLRIVNESGQVLMLPLGSGQMQSFQSPVPPSQSAPSRASQEVSRSLRDKLSLTNEQADSVIPLWNDLEEYDKRPTKIPIRHQKEPLQGRFKAKSKVAPGAEATQRAFLGPNAAPAVKPDANRYMEAIVIRLCHLFPSPVKKGNKINQQMTLVAREYKQIREVIVGNPRVMGNTGLQLMEINASTLSRWYHRSEKRKEKEVLAQAITIPAPAPTETHQLPEPKELLQTHPETPAQQMHHFDLPQNTVGMARLNVQKKKKPAPAAQGSSNPVSTPACTLPLPILPLQIQPRQNLPQPILIAPRPSTTPQFQFPQIFMCPMPVHPEIPAPQMPAQQVRPVPAFPPEVCTRSVP
ncbi:uncharacterized protein LOC135492557 [Lineus longissimus]|uniref:uncharacterized protein LOC135492557 n=1 Tax=Lineus longissimus TaxID=88925 RepID=UPI00315D521E